MKDYITFAKTFENYRWYKPLITIILTVIIYIILAIAEAVILDVIFGPAAIPGGEGGYEYLNQVNIGGISSFISIGLMIPSLYIATRIVRDRPFSSYSSSRGGWNWILYLKCLSIPAVMYLIYSLIGLAMGEMNGDGVVKLSVLTFIIYLIVVPLQCIAEEYIFRGLLMQSFGSWFKIPYVAIILQAILFGVIHDYNSIGVVAILVSGIVMGYLTWKVGGLEASSALHSVNNLYTFIMAGLGLAAITSTVTPIDMLFDIAITVISTALLLYVGRRYEWFGE